MDCARNGPVCMCIICLRLVWAFFLFVSFLLLLCLCVCLQSCQYQRKKYWMALCMLISFFHIVSNVSSLIIMLPKRSCYCIRVSNPKKAIQRNLCLFNSCASNSRITWTQFSKEFWMLRQTRTFKSISTTLSILYRQNSVLEKVISFEKYWTMHNSQLQPTIQQQQMERKDSEYWMANGKRQFLAIERERSVLFQARTMHIWTNTHSYIRTLSLGSPKTFHTQRHTVTHTFLFACCGCYFCSLSLIPCSLIRVLHVPV